MRTLGREVGGRLRGMPISVVVAGSAIAIGSVVRVLHFFARRSLWTDEAALATNIVQRDFGGLLQPLDGNQGAPVLFLWAERAMVLVAGNHEYALRFIPLVAGLALLPMTYLLGKAVGGRAVGATAAVLVALAPGLVRYSTEVKQYSTDAAIAVGLLLVVIAVMERDMPPRLLAALAGAGAIAIWMSHPAIFVLAGAGIVLGLRTIRERRSDRLAHLGGVGAIWAASAVSLYVVSLRDLAGNEFLTGYWQAGFPTSAGTVGGALRWFATTPLDVASDPARLALPALAVAACLAGVAVLTRQKPWHGALLVSAIPFVLLAASMERYPVRGRMVLFAVPLLFVGLAGLVSERRTAVVGLGVIAIVAAGAVLDVARTLPSPPEIAESRPVFEHVRDSWQAGDEVWLHDVTVEPFRYYGPKLGLEADRRTVWGDEARCAAELGGSAHLEAASGSGRVWVVFAYTLSTRPDDEAMRVRRELERYATLLSSFERTDASAVLVDFDRPPAASALAAPPGSSELPEPTESPDEYPWLQCLLAVPEPALAQ